jgi:DNA mismatch repair protein MutS2
VVGTLVQLSGDLEPYLAAFILRAKAEEAGLAVCVPTLATEGERSLEALFNPLLLTHERTVVPCDIVTPRADLVVLVTGPNSGGKTRLLQAVGLAQLLAQGGFFVPAARAHLHLAGGMYASLGQGPTADATEGRLGTELLRIRTLFETVPLGGMVLLDELCSGTNPSEGEELFQLVLGLLAELEPQAFVSTHFLGLAAELERGQSSPSLAFLQVELDAREHPTYRFVQGVARTSLAYRTAQRLGVTREDLLALLQRAKSAGRRNG